MMVKKCTKVIICYIVIIMGGIPLCKFAVFANNLPVTMKYKIKFNGRQKGELTLCVQRDSFQSFYNNVNVNDRLPFFSSTKSGKFNQGIFSNELSFSQKKYDIYYNYTKLPKTIYTHKAYRVDGKAFIVDQKKELIKYVIDHIPVLSFENIIIGFMQQHIPTINDMILFEDETKSLFRIFFKSKEGGKIVRNIKRKKCSYSTYYCMRKNVANQPEKKLFELDVDAQGVPLRISAISGRWEIILDDIYNGEMRLIQMDTYISSVASRNILSKYNISQTHLKTPIQIENITHKPQYKSYDFNYKIKIDMNQNDLIQKQYAAKCFSRTLFPNTFPNVKHTYIENTSNGYQVKVSLNEIYSSILKSNQLKAELKSMNVQLYNFLHIINQKNPGLQLITCDDEYYRTVFCVENQYNQLDYYEPADAAQLYLQKTLGSQSFAVKHVSIISETSTAYSDHSKSVYLSYAIINPGTFSQQDIKRTAKELMLTKLLGNRYIQYPYKHIDRHIKQVGKNYIVEIPQSQICKHLYSKRGNTVVYSNQACEVSGTFQILERSIEAQVKRSMNVATRNVELFKNNNQWFLSTRLKSLPICQ